MIRRVQFIQLSIIFIFFATGCFSQKFEYEAKIRQEMEAHIEVSKHYFQ